MSTEVTDLSRMQSDYKAAVDQWIAAIREEEALASGDHSEAEVDIWEAAALREEDARKLAKDAKCDYENALRQKFFNF